MRSHHFPDLQHVSTRGLLVSYSISDSQGLEGSYIDDIAATLNNLGLVYNSIHNFDMAEKHYTEARDIHMTRADTDDGNLSLTMVKHNLQRNAIQRGINMPTVEELQATVDFQKDSQLVDDRTVSLMLSLLETCLLILVRVLGSRQLIA